MRAKHREPLKGDGITVIIPFRKSEKYRRQFLNFKWNLKYWKCHLPGAQILVGKDHIRRGAFSKSAAINNAVKKATGDVFVIVDADGYISADSVLFCAEEIRKARRKHRRLWYVPYRQFYRLTNKASMRVLRSSPCRPLRIPTPPRPCDIQNSIGSGFGHWYGALIQIVPREAFECTKGWDPRFRGWGGEDHSAMRCTDTLYWRHKTLPGQVLHLWHPMLGDNGKADWVSYEQRLWANQGEPNANGNLAGRYSRAMGDIKKMWALVEEWILSP